MNYLQGLIGIVVVLGFFWLAQFVLKGGLNEANPNTVAIIGAIIGYASAKADAVITYFFGSSKGSADKDAMLLAVGTGNGTGASATTTVTPASTIVKVEPVKQPENPVQPPA